MNPRMAFIGVRSSWLTLARNCDLASLARTRDAFDASSRAVSDRCSSKDSVSRWLVSLTSRASWPNSSPFDTTTCWLRSPAVMPPRARPILRMGMMNAHDRTNPRISATATATTENTTTAVVKSWRSDSNAAWAVSI